MNRGIREEKALNLHFAFQPIVNNRRVWEEKVKHLHFAFQPIVNIRTGVTYGFEALLRNTDKIGYSSIADFFDSAYNESQLYQVDLLLRDKAISEFISKVKSKSIKLFYNIDNRVLDMIDYSPGNTTKILEKYNVSANRICFELTETHQVDNYSKIGSILNIYKQQKYSVAVDDFGTGFSGLELLYRSNPDIIKIDRLFIEGIDEEFKKKLFVSNIVNLVHSLGIKVVAEGVETEAEFNSCKEAGCDLVQGYFVQRPTTLDPEIKNVYQCVIDTNDKDKRIIESDKSLICTEIKKLQIIYNNTDMEEVLEIFKKNSQQFYFPVINELGEPLGIIRVEEIRKYIFSPFGKEVLVNKMKGKTLSSLLTPVPYADINMSLEKILKVFSINRNREGIIITENDRYVGFLDILSLVNLMTEKNLIEAMDKNPLTKLPGNNSIVDYINSSLKNEKSFSTFIYFDFDNFKPFNDIYGFRKGDRAIIMFGDLLRKNFTNSKHFVGHIGGDDFFLGMQTKTKFSISKSKIKYIINEFEQFSKTLYSEEHRKDGFIEAEDRSGQKQKFELLTVSAAILIVHNGDKNISQDILSENIFKVKKRAKQSADKFVVMESSEFRKE